MILQALCRYYERMSAIAGTGMPRQGVSEENISFALSLRPNGTLARIVDLRVGDKKPKPRRMSVPAAVKRAGNGVAPNFLWDNTGYVLGVDGKGRPERTGKTFASFRALHRSVAERHAHPAVQAIDAFLADWKPETFSTLEQAGVLLDQNCVFMWDETGEFIHDLADMPKPEGAANADHDGWCLISGKKAPIARLHPSLKGVWGGQSSGTSLVSFNQDAFTSYGKTQGFNAPVSEEAAFAYTTALNYLLRRENKRCIQIADASTVFWAEQESPAEEMLSGFFTTGQENDGTEEGGDNARAAQVVHSLLDALRKGASIKDVLPEIDLDVRFYILGLAPNAARVSLRFWHVATFGELARRMAEHAEDLSIEHHEKMPEYPGLWRLLLEVAVQGKSENIPPLLGGSLMRSILTGSPYPESLFAAVLSRIRADKQVTYLRAALLKACLIRNHKQEILRMFDPDRTDVPYLLGRLFSLLEKAQLDALGRDLNATIRDRYFGAASATPGIVFPQLLRLAQHHIAKSEYGGIVDRRIQDVMQGISNFPTHLSLPEQGVFAIGYYHQRNANFQKASSDN